MADAPSPPVPLPNPVVVASPVTTTPTTLPTNPPTNLPTTAPAVLSGGTALSSAPGATANSAILSATSGGIAQLGIAFGALGVVLAFMGLFPGVTGISPARGMGAVQFVAVFLGVSLLHLAALVYVKFSFYARKAATFAQQIGVRLVWTGLLFIAIFGLADFVGFGSQPPVQGDSYFGPLQAIGVVGSLLMAGMGVLLYAWGGLSVRTGAEQA